MQLLQTIGHRVGAGFSLPFLILTLALIVGPRLATKVRLPATVGLVLVGMAVGPHCARLLDGHEIALQAWGAFGLLYLMFSAALELDVKLFLQTKRVAITFALLSFAVPFLLGIGSARLLGYPLAASVLMGSNWGSHTLVTYPLLRTAGLGRSRAVASVVGATPITDTSALLVLTGVSFAARRAGSLGVEGTEVAVGLVALIVWSLVALPKIAHWFFAQIGGDRSHRVVFGMVAFLSGALVAEAASIDGIVGAFFAGMGMARVVPARSQLMDRLQFFGSALFIPTFLVSVGVLLAPQVLIVPRTLFVALIFTVAVLGGKGLAAVIAGRLFHFTWPEIGVMAGLSGSQAAATLATTLIGVQLGLFDRQTFNAVLIVILVSLVVTPIMVSHFAKRVARRQLTAESLGSSVLVAVRDEKTRPLLDMGAHIAEADGGIVVAVSIGTEASPASELALRRHMAEAAEEWLAEDGFEARAVFQVAPSVEAGLRETILGEASTLLLAEWRLRPTGDPTEGAVRIALNSPIPVLLAHGAVEPFDRLLVVVPRAALSSAAGPDLALASMVVRGLAGRKRATYLVQPAAPLALLFGPTPRVERLDTDDPYSWLRANDSATDLILFPGMDIAREAFARVPDLGARRFLVAIAARPSPATLTAAVP